jgi:hypothetical protein
MTRALAFGPPSMVMAAPGPAVVGAVVGPADHDNRSEHDNPPE